MWLESKDGKTRLPGGDYFLNSASSRRAVLTYHFRDKGRPARGKPERQITARGRICAPSFCVR